MGVGEEELWQALWRGQEEGSNRSQTCLLCACGAWGGLGMEILEAQVCPSAAGKSRLQGRCRHLSLDGGQRGATEADVPLIGFT